MSKEERTSAADFIRAIVAEDMKTGKWGGRVVTRFPPEPNGYLHIGHAKAFCLDFDIAAQNDGVCHLRFDDTNPTAEEQEYIDAIQDDLRWMGCDWGEHLYYASDYFPQMYAYAEQLIKAGHAYVCDLTAEQTRQHRGSLTEPGKDSPYRNRSVQENLDLFHRMRAGEFPDGSRTLKAKIDMSSPNLNMRDPVMYRIIHAHHHRQGRTWCIYPMYDWAHGLEDSIEGVTHSLCSLEFENHRPLYDWFLDKLGVHHPQQIEFARFNLTYTVMSKRKLRRLVEEGHVNGWDDPRMPTLRGLRRRGYTPESIRECMRRVGMAKFTGTTDIALLEHCLRQHLNKCSPRVMAVLRPLKVVITNYPDGQTEQLEAVNNPEDPTAGTRSIPFSREIYIEQDDFLEDPPKKFFRLAPGREVRLRYAYFITCTEIIKDAAGRIVELHCTYDPATRGGDSPEGRKVKATLHWVSAEHSLPAEVRLYEHLFTCENPEDVGEGRNCTDNLNPHSLQVISDCRIEPSVADTVPGDRFQFERLGYFCTDKDSSKTKLIFNRTVTLRDTWAKIQKQQRQTNR
ncbi:MAG: glutamine--tRNA ligase/YqeY domain fusion protein [Actinobacteria bacterium]|nr:glutamine--tRNA ligase/YqeY domain fusion protein [Actinomycetota bacterium]